MHIDDTLYRRCVGLSLGASIGFVYGIVSQSIDRLYLPGIPLYSPPLGLFGNILLWSLIGALLGLITALPAETITGALYGAATGAFLLTILTLATSRTDEGAWTGKILGVLFLFIPLTGSITPITAIFRWVVNKLVAKHLEAAPVWTRLPIPIALMVLVGAVGSFSRMPPYARIMITQMNEMLQTGLSSPSDSQLPQALQHPLVGGFLIHATNRYSLEWQNKNINRFAIPRSMSNRPWEESVVIARFDNGWNLVCIYPKSDAAPACKGYQNDL